MEFQPAHRRHSTFVQFISPADAGFLITWGLPDAGHALQFCETLYEPDLIYWQPVTATPGPLGANRRQVQTPKNLTVTEGAFFRPAR